MVVAVLAANGAVVVARAGSASGTTQLLTRSTAVAAPAASAGEGVVVPVAFSSAPATTRSRVAPPTRAPGGDERPGKNIADAAPVPKAAPARGPIVGAANGADIEGYARYDPQTTCDPTPKPGTVDLRNLLLARYPNTVSFGISRACDVGGTSEHKEGRAFDWGANVNNPAQHAAVDDFLAQLFATDQYGHKNALARRLGVMYVIWNQQIWGAYQADAGWRPYVGDSPHTDHVHISLSWAGARAETSFYSGNVVTGLPGDDPLPSANPQLPPRPHTPRPTSTTSTSPSTTTTIRRPRRTTTTSTPPPSTSTTTQALNAPAV